MVMDSEVTFVASLIFSMSVPVILQIVKRALMGPRVP